MSKRRPPNPRPLLGGNLPKPIRWQADFDYADQLSPAEREWLDKFVDCYLAGDFRSADQDTWPQELRREAWVRQRVAREDVIGLAGIGGGPDEIPTHQPALDGKDWSPTPGWLEDPEYKAARDAFRATCSPTRLPREPVHTPAFLKARRVLDVITPAAPSERPVVRPRTKPKVVVVVVIKPRKQRKKT